MSIPPSQNKAIYSACEAGASSGLMSASWLWQRLSAAKIDIAVIPEPAIECQNTSICTIL